MLLVENSEFEGPQEASSIEEEPLFTHRRTGKAQNRKLLIFVHGLGGDRYGTWENGRDENHRRRSFPRFIFEEEEALRDVDIGMYAYVTGMKRLKRFWRSSINLEREARVMADTLRDATDYDYIVLIGHSMGGMLIKATVVNLIERPDPATLKRICGLFLLATPQLGSLRIPRWLSLLFHKDLLALKPHGELVSRITERFEEYVLSSAPREKDTNKFVIPAWAHIVIHKSGRLGVSV